MIRAIGTHHGGGKQKRTPKENEEKCLKEDKGDSGNNIGNDNLVVMAKEFPRFLALLKGNKETRRNFHAISTRNLILLVDELFTQRFFYETGDSRLDGHFKKGTTSQLEVFPEFAFEFFLKKYSSRKQAEKVPWLFPP